MEKMKMKKERRMMWTNTGEMEFCNLRVKVLEHIAISLR